MALNSSCLESAKRFIASSRKFEQFICNYAIKLAMIVHNSFSFNLKWLYKNEY